jgi:hypothetical protein
MILVAAFFFTAKKDKVVSDFENTKKIEYSSDEYEIVTDTNNMKVAKFKVPPKEANLCGLQAMKYKYLKGDSVGTAVTFVLETECEYTVAYDYDTGETIVPPPPGGCSNIISTTDLDRVKGEKGTLSIGIVDDLKKKKNESIKAYSQEELSKYMKDYLSIYVDYLAIRQCPDIIGVYREFNGDYCRRHSIRTVNLGNCSAYFNADVLKCAPQPKMNPKYDARNICSKYLAGDTSFMEQYEEATSFCLFTNKFGSIVKDHMSDYITMRKPEINVLRKELFSSITATFRDRVYMNRKGDIMFIQDGSSAGSKDGGSDWLLVSKNEIEQMITKSRSKIKEDIDYETCTDSPYDPKFNPAKQKHDN